MLRAIACHAHSHPLSAVALRSAGDLLATGSRDPRDGVGSELLLWNVARAAPVAQHDVPSEGIGFPDVAGTLSFCPDGERIAMGLDTNVVAVLDLMKMKEVARTTVASGWPGAPAVAWSPDARALIVGCGRAGAARRPAVAAVVPASEDSDPERARWLAPEPHHGELAVGPQRALVWRRDGIVVGHDGMTALAFDPAAGRVLMQTAVTKRARTLLGFSPDGSQLALFHAGAFQLWDALTHRCIARLPALGVDAVVWGPRGQVAVIVGRDQRAHRITWLHKNHLLGSLAADVMPNDGLRFPDGRAWAWSPDARCGALLERSGAIRLVRLNPLPEVVASLPACGGALEGVLWGARDTIVGFDEHRLVFWRLPGTQPIARFRFS